MARNDLTPYERVEIQMEMVVPLLRDPQAVNARDIHRDNPHFEHTREFIEKYDMPAFDESYDSMTLDEFEPMVRRVFSKDLRAAGRLSAS